MLSTTYDAIIVPEMYAFTVNPNVCVWTLDSSGMVLHGDVKWHDNLFGYDFSIPFCLLFIL